MESALGIEVVREFQEFTKYWSSKGDNASRKSRDEKMFDRKHSFCSWFCFELDTTLLSNKDEIPKLKNLRKSIRSRLIPHPHLFSVSHKSILTTTAVYNRISNSIYILHSNTQSILSHLFIFHRSFRKIKLPFCGAKVERTLHKWFSLWVVWSNVKF